MLRVPDRILIVEHDWRLRHSLCERLALEGYAPDPVPDTTAALSLCTTRRFDLIILDPPSFTRNRASIPDALRGYKEIHLRALKLLKSGGTLATFCCSHHIDAATFQNVILDAAYDAHRILRRTAIYMQSPDHPVIPAIPETEYLKGFSFELAA